MHTLVCVYVMHGRVYVGVVHSFSRFCAWEGERRGSRSSWRPRRGLLATVELERTLTLSVVVAFTTVRRQPADARHRLGSPKLSFLCPLQPLHSQFPRYSKAKFDVHHCLASPVPLTAAVSLPFVVPCSARASRQRSDDSPPASAEANEAVSMPPTLAEQVTKKNRLGCLSCFSLKLVCTCGHRLSMYSRSS